MWYAYHKWLIIFVVYDLRNCNSCSMAFPTSMNKNDNIHSFQKSTTNFRFGIFGYLRWILMNRVPEIDMIRLALRDQNQRIFLHLLLLDLGGTWTTLFQITNPRFGLISLALILIWQKCKMSCSWSYISRMKWAITRYGIQSTLLVFVIISSLKPKAHKQAHLNCSKNGRVFLN